MNGRKPPTSPRPRKAAASASTKEATKGLESSIEDGGAQERGSAIDDCCAEELGSVTGGAHDLDSSFDNDVAQEGSRGVGDAGVGYKKRFRGREGSDVRVGPPRELGAVELALRNSSTRKTKYILEPVVGTSFDSLAEAHEFYNLYSWEGFDKRDKNDSARCGCKAMIRLHRSDDDGWFVETNRPDHNHLLSDNCGEKMQWNSHKKIDQATKDTVCYLRENNVSLSKVHCILGSMHKSGDRLPFTKKSLRTICQQIAFDQKDDDIKKTIDLFRSMRSTDLDFAFRFDLDPEDQCRAMEVAIGMTLPGTVHRWCKWHVFRKAKEELGGIFSKKTGFKDAFNNVVNEMLTIDEFEKAWGRLIEDFGLVENSFMIRAFEARHKWAKPYFKDKYCARMTSTQRVESANHMLKTYVPRNSSMNKFVSQCNKLLKDRNEAEDSEEHKNKQCNCKERGGWPIEKHARRIYTRAVMKHFKAELERGQNFNPPKELEARSLYELEHSYAHLRPSWARTTFRVRVEEGERFQCDCGLFGHFGIMCGHVIRLMIHLGLNQIPDFHIMKQWTKSVRDILGPNVEGPSDTEVSLPKSFRHNIMYVSALELVKMGDLAESRSAKVTQVTTRTTRTALEMVATATLGKQLLPSTLFAPDEGAAGHAVGEEQVAENMGAGAVDFADVMVPLEDGDSSSEAGYQAIDEHEDGDDEVVGPRRGFIGDGVRNLMQRQVRARLV
ncbi:hypothetical protein ACQ4PT_000025 [Festuca glaucescens]